jgi:hypothetical protein
VKRKRKKVIGVIFAISLFLLKAGFCAPPFSKQGLNIKGKMSLPEIKRNTVIPVEKSLPDLYIEDIRVSGSYAIKVIIKNRGSRGLTQEEINKCIVSYTPPRGARQSILLRLLPGVNNLKSPNGTVEWEIRNLQQEGIYTAEVDTGNNIQESNETNNVLSKPIYNLISFSIDISPISESNTGSSIYYRGHRITISWNYENAQANEFDIKLLRGGRFVRNIVTAIRGNSYEWWIPSNIEPGNYTIRVSLHNNPSLYALRGIIIKDTYRECEFEVLYPTTGTIYHPGNTLRIGWRINPDKYTKIRRINLNKVNSPGHTQVVATIVQNLDVDSERGEYSYPLPDNIEPGRYILSFILDRLKDNAQNSWDTYVVFVDSQEFLIEEERNF